MNIFIIYEFILKNMNILHLNQFLMCKLIFFFFLGGRGFFLNILFVMFML